MTYYKATRPDGYAFRGGVHYEVGKTVEHPTTKRFGDMRPNEPATYLSVSVEPGEVLIGGSWPCRLFRVEPVGLGVKRTDDMYPHKRGCRALKVVEELPAHMAFGPNGEQVAAIIERARRLTPDEVKRLDAAWGAALDAARAAAWGAALDAALGAARAAALDAALDAARGAAWAALVQDLISQEHYDTLMGPWREVAGEPTPKGDTDE